jgi:acyl-coenzyme A thioesterase PaaI-like protein
MTHGRLACTLLDTVVGCAAHTTLPRGVGYTSIDLRS